MADNQTGLNSQYSQDGRQLVPGTYDHTNAPGSQGVEVSETGPVIATARVSPTGLPDGEGLGRQSVPVEAGDTSSMSDDMPVHQDQLMPGPVEAYLNTGAGGGTVDHWRRKPGQHPAGG